MTVHGTIHGRFQPFHHGHLHYARLALEKSDELTVGLTNPDPTEKTDEPEDRHRHLPEHNPFTYWERYRVIRNVFLQNGISAEAFSIVPLNINDMQDSPWEYYFPDDAHWFVRPKGAWGEEKVRRLRSMNLQVVELPFEQYTSVSGTEIRELMRTGGNWREKIPRGGDVILETYRPEERLRRLREQRARRS